MSFRVHFTLKMQKVLFSTNLGVLNLKIHVVFFSAFLLSEIQDGGQDVRLQVCV